MKLHISCWGDKYHQREIAFFSRLSIHMELGEKEYPPQRLLQRLVLQSELGWILFFSQPISKTEE